MKELLYKKSEAVAALNRVDGFHPMELARKIGEEGQEEQLYLDTRHQIPEGHPDCSRHDGIH